LTDAERQLLRRLSVFAGGCTLDAAEAICVGDAAERASTIDSLTSLTEKSLLSADEKLGAPRFNMLQTVREYARVRLQEDDDPARWRARHADHFLALSEASAPRLDSADQDVVEELESEHDNLREALACCTESAGLAGRGLRMASALYLFWWKRGEWGEGLAALRRALGSEGPQEPPVRADALHAAGVLVRLLGDCVEARSLHEQSLAIRRTLNDAASVASSLLVMGVVDQEQGHHDSARDNYVECLEFARRSGQAKLVAKALNNLGNLESNLGNYAAARLRLEAALQIRRDGHDLRGVANSLHNLAVIAGAQGDFVDAKAKCEESLQLHRVIGERRSVATALCQLGTIAFKMGDQPVGVEMVKESLSILSDLNDRWGVLNALDALAAIVAPVSAERAARVWGSAEGLRETSGNPQIPILSIEIAERVASARASMKDEESFERAWKEGRAMDLRRAVAYALERS
jgi:tetratricopeptide (TPR) repeat protein